MCPVYLQACDLNLCLSFLTCEMGRNTLVRGWQHRLAWPCSVKAGCDPRTAVIGAPCSSALLPRYQCSDLVT